MTAVVFGDATGDDAFRGTEPFAAIGGDRAMGDGAVVGDDSEGAAAAHLHVFHGQIPESTEGNATAGIGIDPVIEPCDGGGGNGGVPGDFTIPDRDVVETTGDGDAPAGHSGRGAEGEAVEVESDVR